MAITKEIKSKIASVQNTQKITKAMEMVASSKMRKARDRMSASRPYAEMIRSVIGNLAHGNLEYNHSYLENREVKRVGYIAISTDRGLCGGLNMSLFKTLFDDMKGHFTNNVEVDMVLVGSKAAAFFGRIKGNNIIGQVTGIGDDASLTKLVGPIQVLLKAFDEGRIDRVFVVYNKLVNTMLQQPKVEQLLPFVPSAKSNLAQNSWDYLYEPDPKTLLDVLVRRYIESQVYQGVVENLASEQAARMVAMKAATDNGVNLIKDLQLVYNKARQASITQELTEIVSGSAAISS